MSSFDSFNRADRQIAIWLILVAVLIFCMVILGGATRLTGSGLSMVNWDPIMGTVPPLNESEWQDTFEKYQQFPEYQKINPNMSLQEFKGIFVFEYSHRVLGRAIGLAFLIPFLYFFFTKKINRRLVPKLVVMFILGGAQGLLGWYMVKSGLVDNPNVSQYRLAAHLVAAILIYSYILWTAWSLLSPTPRNSWAPGIVNLQKQMRWFTALIILMIISGAFVAGTHAGGVHKTFPDMSGHLLPPGLFSLSPFYLNFFDNPATVQFEHRLIAYAIIVFTGFIWYKSKNYTLTSQTRNAFHLLLIIMMAQVALGISTLLSDPGGPVRAGVVIELAISHQAGALLLLTTALNVNHKLRSAGGLS